MQPGFGTVGTPAVEAEIEAEIGSSNAVPAGRSAVGVHPMLEDSGGRNLAPQSGPRKWAIFSASLTPPLSQKSSDLVNDTAVLKHFGSFVDPASEETLAGGEAAEF
jgi:hypothetical protein